MAMPMSHNTDEGRKTAPSGVISLLTIILLVLSVLAVTGCDLERDHGGGPDNGGSSGGHSGGCH